MVKNQIVMSLNNNKTSVTGMVMTVDKSRLVTSGLDKSVTVWNIFRNKGVYLILLRQLKKFNLKK